MFLLQHTNERNMLAYINNIKLITTQHKYINIYMLPYQLLFLHNLFLWTVTEEF